MDISRYAEENEVKVLGLGGLNTVRLLPLLDTIELTITGGEARWGRG